MNNPSQKFKPSLTITVLYLLLAGCTGDGGSCCGGHLQTDMKTSAPVSEKQMSSGVSPSRFPLAAETRPSTFKVGDISISVSNQNYDDVLEIQNQSLKLSKEKLEVRNIDTGSVVFQTSSENQIKFGTWSPQNNQFILYTDQGVLNVLSLDESTNVSTIKQVEDVSTSIWLSNGKLVSDSVESNYYSLKILELRSPELEVEKRIKISVKSLQNDSSAGVYRATIEIRNASGSLQSMTQLESQGYVGVDMFCVGADGVHVYGLSKSINMNTGAVESSSANCAKDAGLSATSFDGRYAADYFNGVEKWSGKISYSVSTSGLEYKSLNTADCPESFATGDLSISYVLELQSSSGQTVKQVGAANWSQSKASCSPDHCG